MYIRAEEWNLRMSKKSFLKSTKNRKCKEQIIRFVCVGGIATAIDYTIMTTLIEIFEVEYFHASSFSMSVIVNYRMSLCWVYSTEERKYGKFISFLLLSLVGLGINQFLMWFSITKLGIHYIVSKAGATIIVMIYNFMSRKLLLEGKSTEK